MTEYHYILCPATNIDWDHVPDVVTVKYTDKDLERWTSFKNFLFENKASHIYLEECPVHNFWDTPFGDEGEVLINEEPFNQASLPFPTQGGEVVVYKSHVNIEWKNSENEQEEVWACLVMFDETGHDKDKDAEELTLLGEAVTCYKELEEQDAAKTD